jgi:hypothetical protein
LGLCWLVGVQRNRAIILLWKGVERRPERQVVLLLAHLKQVEEDLREGSTVVFLPVF